MATSERWGHAATAVDAREADLRYIECRQRASASRTKVTSRDVQRVLTCTSNPAERLYACCALRNVARARESGLQPGAALYLCGPAIAQHKRHWPEGGHRLEALGATDYVRIRWYGRAKQHRLAYGARLSHRGTVVQHRACTCALAATSRRVAKRTAGSGDIIDIIRISCL